MENPYPETLVNETSGVEVPDNRHRIWDEGFEAGSHCIIERVGRDLILAKHPNFFD